MHLRCKHKRVIRYTRHKTIYLCVAVDNALSPHTHTHIYAWPNNNANIHRRLKRKTLIYLLFFAIFCPLLLFCCFCLCHCLELQLFEHHRIRSTRIINVLLASTPTCITYMCTPRVVFSSWMCKWKRKTCADVFRWNEQIRWIYNTNRVLRYTYMSGYFAVRVHLTEPNIYDNPINWWNGVQNGGWKKHSTKKYRNCITLCRKVFCLWKKILAVYLRKSFQTCLYQWIKDSEFIFRAHTKKCRLFVSQSHVNTYMWKVK